MIRSMTILGAAVLLSFAAACDRPAVEERANRAQTEANDKITAAKDEAARKISDAQAEADKRIAAAKVEFTKTLEDYRRSTQANLDELNKKIDALDAKSKTLQGKARMDLEGSVGTIRVMRDAFVADRKSLETTTATVWDDTKQRLDQEWNDLDARVECSIKPPIFPILTGRCG